MRLGQNIDTREFVIFKPFARENKETEEVTWLKELGDYKGCIDVDDFPLVYVGMNFVDGITFRNLKKIIPDKINPHARYLIAYNFIRALKNLSDRQIIQEDMNPGNMMIRACNFDVKIVDFGSMGKGDWNPYVDLGFIDSIFSPTSPPSSFPYRGYVKNYQKGTFEEFIKKVVEFENDDKNFLRLKDILQILPNF